jgi:hypothetical protein
MKMDPRQRFGSGVEGENDETEAYRRPRERAAWQRIWAAAQPFSIEQLLSSGFTNPLPSTLNYALLVVYLSTERR